MHARSLLFASVILAACARSATKPAAKMPSQRTPIASAAPPTAPTARGGGPAPECIDAEKDAIATWGLADAKGRPYEIPTNLRIDLDGDGVPDDVLEISSDGTSTRYELYLERMGCAKKLGTITVPGTLSEGRGMSNGIKVLEVEGKCLEGCCRSIAHEELAFDGAKFVTKSTWTVPKICP